MRYEMLGFFMAMIAWIIAVSGGYYAYRAIQWMIF